METFSVAKNVCYICASISTSGTAHGSSRPSRSPASFVLAVSSRPSAFLLQATRRGGQEFAERYYLPARSYIRRDARKMNRVSPLCNAVLKNSINSEDEC